MARASAGLPMPAPAVRVLPSGGDGQEPFPSILEALEHPCGSRSPATPRARAPKESGERTLAASPQASRMTEHSGKAQDQDRVEPLARTEAPKPPAAEVPAPSRSASTAHGASLSGSASQPTLALQTETAAETGDPSPPAPASPIASAEPPRDFASAMARGPFSEMPPANLWSSATQAGSANQAAAPPWSRSRSDAPASDSRKSEPAAGTSEPRMAASRNAPQSQPVLATRTAYYQAAQPAALSGQTAQPDPPANAWRLARTQPDRTGAAQSAGSSGFSGAGEVRTGSHRPVLPTETSSTPAVEITAVWSGSAHGGGASAQAAAGSGDAVSSAEVQRLRVPSGASSNPRTPVSDQAAGDSTPPAGGSPDILSSGATIRSRRGVSASQSQPSSGGPFRTGAAQPRTVDPSSSATSPDQELQASGSQSSSNAWPVTSASANEVSPGDFLPWTPASQVNPPTGIPGLNPPPASGNPAATEPPEISAPTTSAGTAIPSPNGISAPAGASAGAPPNTRKLPANSHSQALTSSRPATALFSSPLPAGAPVPANVLPHNPDAVLPPAPDSHPVARSRAANATTAPPAVSADTPKDGKAAAGDQVSSTGVWNTAGDVSGSDASTLPPLAFRAIVTPLSEFTASADPADSSAKSDPASPQPVAASDPAGNSTLSVAVNAAQPAPPAAPGTGGPSVKDETADSSRAHKAEVPIPPAQADAGTARWTPAPPPESGGATRSAERTAQPPAPPAKAAPELPEDAKPGAKPVRDIKLDLGVGDGRVEVHVADRGGELRVAVHTPDERLAGDLREHLPSLSARLEQSGLRAETWHPAAGGERMRAAETASSADSQSPGGQGQSQSDGRRQDAPPRRPKLTEEPSPDQNKGNDFAWLMDALR